MEYSSPKKQRFAELRPGKNGRLQAEWQLTDTKLIDAVRLTLPPTNAIPIIFVPGIMGSNLCNLKNKPVWLLNGFKDKPVGLAWDWAGRKAGARQAILHPERTKVYDVGAVPKGESASARTAPDYLKRGWGEVSEASYHKFLLWLDTKMNGERNPAFWSDFENSSLGTSSTPAEQLIRKLPTGLIMKMYGLPDVAENGHVVDSITSDELLKRSKSIFPVYAFGYNWLASNEDAAKSLKARIRRVISENNVGTIKCTQVILVTHSMGGLVARACSQLPDMPSKIVGIVHGVMPATGAAVAYRRCKVGMRDEDFKAGLVIGSDGKQVAAVFAQSPGALQLLPSEDYGTKWLEVNDPSGKLIAALPIADPYDEIYLQKDKWWGLIREDWLSPEKGMPISWDKFAKNVKTAKEFHRRITGSYHRNTYVFYGGGAEKRSFSKIRWNIKKGILSSMAHSVPVTADFLNLSHRDVRTDGSNNLYVGGETVVKTTSRGDAPVAITTETSFWEVRCGQHDSAGDGTVPAHSGQDPRHSGGMGIRQQFELAGIEHEPAYRDYPIAQQVTYYAITKLAAMADLS
ncbi:MAG: esterase/lipase family protein [Massilia sp.]